jgi:serine phosphatase RsbU (regulator of sigma subunit)
MHYDPQNKRAYIFIGDVTGHGIPSAIMTGVACGAVLGGQRRAELLQQRIYNHFSEHFSNLGLTSLLDSQHFPKNDPTFQLEELANSLHETFMKTGARSSRLMTMLFLSLDVATGELTYLNAGHNPFYLLSRGEVKAVISGGSIIGFRRERAPSFASRKLMLAPGDAIFVHTDGLVENTGSNQLDVLSPKKLKAKLQSVYTRPVQEIVDGVVSDALALWGDAAQEDDTAIVAFRWLGPHSAKSAEPAPGEPDAPGRAS